MAYREWVLTLAHLIMKSGGSYDLLVELLHLREKLSEAIEGVGQQGITKLAHEALELKHGSSEALHGDR